MYAQHDPTRKTVTASYTYTRTRTGPAISTSRRGFRSRTFTPRGYALACRLQLPLAAGANERNRNSIAVLPGVLLV